MYNSSVINPALYFPSNSFSPSSSSTINHGEGSNTRANSLSQDIRRDRTPPIHRSGVHAERTLQVRNCNSSKGLQTHYAAAVRRGHPSQRQLDFPAACDSKCSGLRLPGTKWEER